MGYLLKSCHLFDSLKTRGKTDLKKKKKTLPNCVPDRLLLLHHLPHEQRSPGLQALCSCKEHLRGEEPQLLRPRRRKLLAVFGEKSEEIMRKDMERPMTSAKICKHVWNSHLVNKSMLVYMETYDRSIFARTFSESLGWSLTCELSYAPRTTIFTIGGLQKPSLAQSL